MDLEDNDIREFMDLWKAEFHEDLSPEQARLQASLLLELYARLAEPFPRPEQGASQKHQLT